MPAWDKGECLTDIGSQLVWRAGLTWVIACDGEAASEGASSLLESADVVSLPALEGNRNCGERFEGFVNINAHLGVPFSRESEGVRKLSAVHRCEEVMGVFPGFGRLSRLNRLTRAA